MDGLTPTAILLIAALGAGFYVGGVIVDGVKHAGHAVVSVFHHSRKPDQPAK